MSASAAATQCKILPTHLVSEIVGMANAANGKDPVVVQIHPDTGKQVTEPNSALVARLTESVRGAAKLLKQYRRFFKLAHRELSDLDPEDEDEIVEAIEELAEEDPDIDEVVKEAAYCYFGIDEADCCVCPISQAFYRVAFDIANQLSSLTLKMRREYLTMVIETIHEENPDLDLAMYEFIAYYTKDYPLVQKVFPNIPAWAIAEQEADAAHPTFQFAYEQISAFSRNDSLDVFKWANRSEEERKRWLSVVNGEEWKKKSAQKKSIVDGLLELYPHCTREQVMSKVGELQKKGQLL